MALSKLNAFLTDKIDDMKATDVVVVDITDKSSVTDFMVICTATSKRHAASIANHVADEAKDAGLHSFGMNGENEGEWIVVDLGDSMLHIMQEEYRHIYQLEKLWD